MRLVLASASPRRAELLTGAGFSFEICTTDVDERVIPRERPQDYVRRLAMEKSAAALSALVGSAKAGHGGRAEGSTQTGGLNLAIQRADANGAESGFSRATIDRTNTGGDDVLIVGADTAVIVDGEILGKPVDDFDAARMLRSLSGRAHVVMTGVSVRSALAQFDAVEETRVFVQALSDEDVAWYVASGEGRDKAGAYAIQGLASRFIPRIEGSYSNVVGLPVARVAELIHMAELRLGFLASGR